MSPIPTRPLLVLGVAAALALAAAGPASASPKATLQCGQTVTHSVKLNADLSDCPGNGLVIGANDVTVDLSGHTIEGVPLRSGCDSPEDERSGVANHGGYDRMVVEDGTIQHFDKAVAIGAGTVGTSDSRVHHLVVRDARFAGLDIGSGAGAAATARDRFDHNDISGVTCGAGLDLNTASANRFDHNRVSDADTGVVICCGDLSDGNVLEDNRIEHITHVGVLWFESGAGRLAGNSLSDIGDTALSVIGSFSSGTVVAGNSVSRAFAAAVEIIGCPDCDTPGTPALHDVRVVGNTAHATGDGLILEDTEGDLVRDNTVIAAGSAGAPDSLGLGLGLFSVRDTVARANTFLKGRPGPEGPDITSAGILVGDPEAPADAAPTSGNLLAGNAIIGQDGDGIHVTAIAQDTTLHRNLTNRNTADGIHAESAATTLRDNEADRNGAFGIEAIAGVTDAGGNRAHGNGNPAQCSGVVCG
jgi:hypothetical protein